MVSLFSTKTVRMAAQAELQQNEELLEEEFGPQLINKLEVSDTHTEP